MITQGICACPTMTAVGFLDRLRETLQTQSPAAPQPQAPAIDATAAPPFSASAQVAQRFSLRRQLAGEVSAAQVSFRDWTQPEDWGYSLGNTCRQMVFAIQPVPGGPPMDLRITLAPFQAPGRFHVPSFGNSIDLVEVGPDGSRRVTWRCVRSYGNIIVDAGGTSGAFDRVRLDNVDDGGRRLWLVGNWSLV
jgi:hypothetical protein